MTDDTTRVEQRSLDSATEDFAQQIADGVESFLLAVRAISRGEATGGQATMVGEARRAFTKRSP